MLERTELAASSPSTVIVTGGLPAVFNDAGVLDPIDLLSAQTIARLHGETDELVTLAAALTVRGTRFGHVCVVPSTLRDAVVVDGQDPAAVDALPWPEATAWEEALSTSPLVGDGSGDEPLVWNEGRLYLERYFRYERQVAGLIQSRLGDQADRADAWPDRAIPQGHLVEPGDLSARRRRTPVAEPLPGVRAVIDRLLTDDGRPTSQHRAASTALNGRVTVIAGGPGTGKTFTVGALLVALASGEDFPLVALCAPTGKAAARLGEAVAARAAASGAERIVETLARVHPSTIHRLLGWSWGRGRFARNATNRLPHDLVVVDEMSMVSLPLAARLLGAVRDDAAVVLVGDPFQLESIEAGTVLADIVGPATDAPPAEPMSQRVVVLDRVYRFQEEDPIGEFADTVRRGDPDPALELLEAGEDRLRWVPDPSDPGFGELWEEVVTQRSRLVTLARRGDTAGSLEALGEVAVLCARKRGPAGVGQWGRDVEEALDERFPGLRWGGEWYPGRPVMITRNDYNLDLYNGDIGVAVETGDGLRAVFERGQPRAFPLSHLTEHTTVHAMTIHKSQGSQFDQVVVVLPEGESRLLTRELLYTAVTRARQRVWLVGPQDVVRQAIGRSVERASGLGTLLWGDTDPLSPRGDGQ